MFIRFFNKRANLIIGLVFLCHYFIAGEARGGGAMRLIGPHNRRQHDMPAPGRAAGDIHGVSTSMGPPMMIVWLSQVHYRLCHAFEY